MRPVAQVLILAALLSACGSKLPEGIDEPALAEAMGSAVGDDFTCVLLLKRGGGVVWRYGSNMTCARARPACDGGETSVEALGKKAAKGAEVAVSCPGPTGLTAWAAGPVPAGAVAKQGEYAYAAGMTGTRTLPSREIAIRVEGALARSGF